MRKDYLCQQWQYYCMVYEDIHFHDRSKEAQKISRQISRWQNEVFLFGPHFVSSVELSEIAVVFIGIVPHPPLDSLRADIPVHAQYNIHISPLSEHSFLFGLSWEFRQKIGSLDMFFARFILPSRNTKCFFPSGKHHIDCS